MVVKRIDRKYALHLPLTKAGFDFSVLCEFRQRLLTHHTKGLVKARGLQRTDALAVVAAVARLSGAETVGTPHDPEARYSEKRDVGWVGQVHVTETVESDLPLLITDIQTTVAPAPDEA